MSKQQMLDEIRETNLAYLLLAQQLVKLDKATGMFRLGISDDVAQVLEKLSSGQMLKMAASNMLLCRFRFDDSAILDLFTSDGNAKPMVPSHAAVLMAGQPALGLA